MTACLHYVVVIPDLSRCEQDLGLLHHLLLSLSTPLWQSDAILVVVVDTDATQEHVDFLVVVHSLGLTRDHVSVFIVEGTIMCLRNVEYFLGRPNGHKWHY